MLKSIIERLNEEWFTQKLALLLFYVVQTASAVTPLTYELVFVSTQILL